MKRLSVANLCAGMQIGKTVTNERGDILLYKGVALNPRYIDLLRVRGFQTLYVQNEYTKDIFIEEAISEPLRARATRALSDVHRSLVRAGDLAGIDIRHTVPEKLSEVFQLRDFKQMVFKQSPFQRLRGVSEELVAELSSSAMLTGLPTVKSLDSYIHCHSVDVAVTAIILGKHAFLEKEELIQLGLGCLLHDIGMFFVDPAVLAKAGEHTPEEAERIQRHASIGYDLLRALQSDEVRANHIAYQHHERQDGRGYPRGLSGSNLLRRGPLAIGPGKILILAEIAAIADTYDTLSSDRPGNPALPPEQVVDLIRGLAGTVLNREIVSLFLGILPVFPAGLEIHVVQGAYAGYHGIVVEVSEQAMDRPQIRLTEDDAGRRITPFDVDLNTGKNRDIVLSTSPAAR